MSIGERKSGSDAKPERGVFLVMRRLLRPRIMLLLIAVRIRGCSPGGPRVPRGWPLLLVVRGVRARVGEVVLCLLLLRQVTLARLPLLLARLRMHRRRHRPGACRSSRGACKSDICCCSKGLTSSLTGDADADAPNELRNPTSKSEVSASGSFESSCACYCTATRPPSGDSDTACTQDVQEWCLLPMLLSPTSRPQKNENTNDPRGAPAPKLNLCGRRG